MKKILKILCLLLLTFSFSCNTAFACVGSSNEQVSIKWFGHSSFGIKDSNKSDTMKIVTDPYGEGLGYNFPKISTDILTVSHKHFDHNNIAALQNFSACISGIGNFKINDVEVKGIASYHDEENGKLRGENTIFTYKINKLRICHLGDLGHILTKKEIQAIGKVDILMIPVGGVYTIDSQNAAKVIGQLNPKIVIPMHYKTEVLPEDFGDIDKVDKFTSLMKGWKVEKLDVLKISKKEIDKLDSKKIVILSYK